MNMFAYCNLAIVPLRAEPSDKSEMVSQVLYGEHFTILEHTEKWSKIQLAFDQYIGWIDNKQFEIISQEDFDYLQATPITLSVRMIDFLTSEKQVPLPISIGSCLNVLARSTTNTDQLKFNGKHISGVKTRKDLIDVAFLYINSSYLWGGKTPFGIDCSGFTQMVYKLCGHSIPRDASQQAAVGEALSFIEESEPGDLAFFDNNEGNIVHVGIIMEDNYIIHAHGKVRVDRLDHFGIYNVDTGKHTHKLRVIKKMF